MKSARHYILVGVATTLSLLAAFFLWGLYHRYTLEQQANVLMTETSQRILESGDPTLLFENVDPASNFVAPDLSALPLFGQLVTLEPLEGAADVPSPLSSRVASAQFRTTGHFSLGVVHVEAILTYQDDRWQFSNFAVIPGQFAQ